MSTQQEIKEGGEFDAAFDQLYRKAYWASHRILRSHEDCEDVAIETLARASVHWRSIRANPSPWVVKVSVNLAIDGVRREKYHLELKEVAAPEEAIAERMDLLAAIRQLPTRQRTVIALRYLADLSEEQVSDALGCSLGTVKQHTSRAISKLRHIIVRDIASED